LDDAGCHKYSFLHPCHLLDSSDHLPSLYVSLLTHRTYHLLLYASFAMESLFFFCLLSFKLCISLFYICPPLFFPL
jgi:hypothetical protein